MFLCCIILTCYGASQVLVTLLYLKAFGVHIRLNVLSSYCQCPDASTSAVGVNLSVAPPCRLCMINCLDAFLSTHQVIIVYEKNLVHGLPIFKKFMSFVIYLCSSYIEGKDYLTSVTSRIAKNSSFPFDIYILGWIPYISLSHVNIRLNFKL